MQSCQGGRNLHYDWNPDGVSRGPEDAYRGPMYPELTRSYAEVCAALAGEGVDSTLSALLWMQGERDSVFGFMADRYASNLRRFTAAVRSDFGVPDLPFSD